MQNTEGAIMKNKGVFMKYLLIILLTINFASAQMTQSEIDFQNNFSKAIKVLAPSVKLVSHKKYISFCDPLAVVVDENGNEIAARCGFVRTGCFLENCNDYELDHEWYSFKKYSELDTVPEFYETIMMFNKPTKLAIQVEVDKILAERQAKLDWKNRVLFIKDARVLLKRCGNNEINGQSVLNRIHLNKLPQDLILLACIETEKEKLDSELAVIKSKEDKIKIGMAIRKACDSAINLIIGYNIHNNLSKIQIDSMQVTFAPTEKALRSFRPLEAKTQIQTITPDGIVVTQKMKDEVLDIINKLLAQ